MIVFSMRISLQRVVYGATSFQILADNIGVNGITVAPFGIYLGGTL